MILRTTIPFTRFNNYLELTPNQQAILVEYANDFFQQTFVDPTIDGNTNDCVTRFNAPFLKQSLIYVITETVGDYPYPYFSEKTWKAIVTGCPFMLINTQYSLAKLKEFGFKTFDQWWDEGYDKKVTVADRIEAVVNELIKLSKLSITELEDLRQEMSPVILHNQKHLEIFTASDLENITNQI
jgi:hypothetical protein